MKMALVVWREEIVTEPAWIPDDLTKLRTVSVRLWSSSRPSVWIFKRALATRQGPVFISTVGCSGAFTETEAIFFDPLERFIDRNRPVGASAHYTHKNYSLEVSGFTGQNQ